MNILGEIKKQKGCFVNVVEQNKLITNVNRLSKINFDPKSFNTQNRPDGMFIFLRQTAAADSFPWDKLLFGYSISGNKFTVKAGEIHYLNTIVNVAETELTIADDLTYVYVRFNYSTHVATIEQTTDIAVATSDATYYKKWLYLVNYTAPSSVAIKTYGWIGGSIDIVGLGWVINVIDDPATMLGKSAGGDVGWVELETFACPE